MQYKLNDDSNIGMISPNNNEDVFYCQELFPTKGKVLF